MGSLPWWQCPPLPPAGLSVRSGQPGRKGEQRERRRRCSLGSGKKQAFPGFMSVAAEPCLLPRHPLSFPPPSPPHASPYGLGPGAQGWLNLGSTCQTESPPLPSHGDGDPQAQNSLQDPHGLADLPPRYPGHPGVQRSVEHLEGQLQRVPLSGAR